SQASRTRAEREGIAMKAMKKALLGVVAASAVGAGFAISAAASGATGSSATPSTKLTAAEQTGLQFSRDEERMARDLYRQFADKYATTPFTMINQSEQ